jgi:hypothetical protein
MIGFRMFKQIYKLNGGKRTGNFFEQRAYVKLRRKELWFLCVQKKNRILNANFIMQLINSKCYLIICGVKFS